jgi:hypothetical protein
MGSTTPNQYLIAKQASQHDEKELKDLVSTKLYKHYTLMIAARKSTYGEGLRIDYSALRVYPGEFPNINGTYLKMLESYKVKESVMAD